MTASDTKREILELRPCPFCGNPPAEANAHARAGHGDPLRPLVRCKSRGCAIGFETGWISIEDWNRRAAKPDGMKAEPEHGPIDESVQSVVTGRSRSSPRDTGENSGSALDSALLTARAAPPAPDVAALLADALRECLEVFDDRYDGAPDAGCGDMGNAMVKAEAALALYDASLRRDREEK